MLNTELIAKTEPIANSENIVFWKDYRVTVLESRLFRIEKNAETIFRDAATQTVWYRNMPKQIFDVTVSNDKAIIKTAHCSLVLYEDRNKCRILINGKKKKINNSGNLLGTCRTLDKCDGDYCYDGLFLGDRTTKSKVVLNSGVCSLSGIAVFDDANSFSLGGNGLVIEEKGKGTDEYVFAFGDDYRGAVKALLAISGDIPMPPRYALGNWWSRYHAYTDKEYLSLMQRFENERIPFTVAMIDMDWHYSDYVVQEKNVQDLRAQQEDPDGIYKIGWTGYSWNKKLFPDYKAFLKVLHEKNLRVALNLHPSDGVRYWEDMYVQMAEAMGVDSGKKQRIPFDITDEKFINNYFDIIHTPYEKDGVDFWWVDWQQGTNTKIPGLDPLWLLNHYHYLHAIGREDRALLLSRYAGIGSHRYSLGFSGDTFVSWKTLNFLPYFTATASNIGYSWWSHDIGGHLLGVHDNELYLRHIQFGVFSPINRLHSCNSLSATKEPFAYKNGIGNIAADWLRLRHRLIPFLYAHAYHCTRLKEPLIQPLYYEYKNRNAYVYKGEYLFGENLLVVPITTHTKKDGYARVKAWLPKGVWTDIFTLDIYRVSEENGRIVTFMRGLDSIPVFAKEGTILPLSSEEGNGSDNPCKMEIRVYSGNGKFDLYEDDGTDAKNNILKFVSEYSEKDGKIIRCLKIISVGDDSFLPNNRIFKINFINVYDEDACVFVNGKKISSVSVSDHVSFDLVYKRGKEYIVELKYKKLDELAVYKKKALKILQETEGNYEQKDWLFFALEAVKDKRDMVGVIEESKVRGEVKSKLKEIL